MGTVNASCRPCSGLYDGRHRAGATSRVRVRFNRSPYEIKQQLLTNLYNNARPTWLASAHTAVDRAVWDAFGWPAEVAEDVILSRLLALNGERAGDT